MGAQAIKNPGHRGQGGCSGCGQVQGLQISHKGMQAGKCGAGLGLRFPVLLLKGGQAGGKHVGHRGGGCHGAQGASGTPVFYHRQGLGAGAGGKLLQIEMMLLCAVSVQNWEHGLGEFFPIVFLISAISCSQKNSENSQRLYNSR